VVLGLVRFPLVYQPRLGESAEEPFPHLGGLRLHRRQEFREVVHRELTLRWL
jgi:hypothetical protein